MPFILYLILTVVHFCSSKKIRNEGLPSDYEYRNYIATTVPTSNTQVILVVSYCRTVLSPYSTVPIVLACDGVVAG